MGTGIHAVTGAYGYSGRYISRRLLDDGHDVLTLTNSSPNVDPFNGRVRSFPLNFARQEDLETSLSGVDVLYNTYWVRFNHKHFTHREAVNNTRVLFDAAANAGVKRVVHVSITNPSLESPLEYFRGKAQLEEALRESSMSHAILRPTVLFGREDILINNIAWMLRRFPVFAVFGDGSYRLQPIFVDDLAELAARYGADEENVTVNAIGPETFTYRELVVKIGEIVGCERRILSVSPRAGYSVAAAIGKMVGDVVITPDEIRGLMSDLLYVESPPAGQTRLTDWAREHSSDLGRQYASELARRNIRAG